MVRTAMFVTPCALLLCSAGLPARAQSAPASFVGSWSEAVSYGQGTPLANTLAAFVSFTSDETVIDSAQTEGAGHGVRTGAGNAAAVKLERFANPIYQQPEARVVEIDTGSLTMTDANTFTGSGSLVLFHASGQVVETIPFTTKGVRITLP